MAQGHGKYTHADGASYDGMWLNDKQHGQGQERWPDGSLYVGGYVNGLKHG